MNKYTEATQPNYERWFSSEKLPIELSALLKSRIMQDALNVLVESGISNKCPLGSALETHALRNAYRDGYFDFLKNLQLLTVPPGKDEAIKPLPPPFEGYLDEEKARNSTNK